MSGDSQDAADDNQESENTDSQDGEEPKNQTVTDSPQRLRRRFHF